MILCVYMCVPADIHVCVFNEMALRTWRKEGMKHSACKGEWLVENLYRGNSKVLSLLVKPTPFVS